MPALAPADSRDDVALLQGVVAGSPDAVRVLLHDVAPIVYGFLYARVGGDEASAEDLLQETLLEAVRSAAGFRGDATLSTWLCAIARRRLARYYERERRAEVARAGLHLHAGEQRDDNFDLAVDDHDEVVRALGRLAAGQRQVLVLKYLDGLSVERIAEETGRTRVQVQSLLQRARGALRRELSDD